MLVLVACMGIAACTRLPKKAPPPPPPTTTAPPASDIQWSSVPASDGSPIKVGALASTKVGASGRATILLLHNASGISFALLDHARAYRDRGYNTVVACWFAASNDVVCPGPPALGVTDAALPDLQTIVSAARKLFAGPLLVEGHSFGGAASILLATVNGADLFVGASGTYHGWYPGDIDLPTRAGTISAPVLLVHGTNDALVPVSNAYDLIDALTAAGHPPETTIVVGGTHNLDLAALRSRVMTFACSHGAGCPL